MRILLLLPILLLSGCLTTSKQAFTADNSIKASESRQLLAFVDAWEAKTNSSDSPRSIIDNDLRVIEMDGMVVIEEPKGNGSAEYYAVGMFGNRPISCFVHQAQVEEVADRNGVTIKIEQEGEEEQIGPVPMSADGDQPELNAFVRDVFANGSLACFTPPKGGLK